MQGLGDILRFEVGQLRVISSMVMPSATTATTVVTGMRGPRMHGMPPPIWARSP
jgi:hypothetical protein